MFHFIWKGVKHVGVLYKEEHREEKRTRRRRRGGRQQKEENVTTRREKRTEKKEEEKEEEEKEGQSRPLSKRRGNKFPTFMLLFPPSISFSHS